MKKGKRILVKSGAGVYAVVSGSGVLKHLGREIGRLGKFSSVQVVTSAKVWRAVGRKVQRGLRGLRFHLHKMDDRETAKNMRNVERIARSLVQSGADRRAVIVAVGGGVVGDVAGFAAASYLRGVALVQVPTTVVAQTDSAIGGKTGVNLPEGKNLVGAFYPPRMIAADSLALESLSDREFRGGLAEVIKYGVIIDKKLFSFLERNFDKLLARDEVLLAHAISRSIEIKAEVVSKDERESGLREILNFGHTFGHALESVTGYKKFKHGEAVAWGMIAAALYGHEIGVTPAADAARIIALTKRMGGLPAWPNVAPKKLLARMGSDKKARAGKLRFVLTPRIGKASTFEVQHPEKLELVLRMTPKAANAKPVAHE